MEEFTNKIVLMPDPVLRLKSADIANPLSLNVKKLILDMIKTMRANNGIGLAAPQIGKSVRLIVVEKKDEAIALINPVISRKSLFKTIEEEGCLSVPGINGLVKRHKNIKVKALDEKGYKIIINASGMFARVIQHEIDHLDGILFIDKIISYTRK